MIGSLEEVYKSMEDGTYDFTDNGKCTSCGACCSAILPMTRNEIREIKRYIRKKNIKLSNHVVGTPFLQKPEIDMTCPFRDNVNRICKIYEFRPVICRTFRCDKTSKGERDKQDEEFAKKDFKVVNLWEIFGES